MPKVGDLLDEKYRLERLLGKGGMGKVFEAKHERIGKRLAVKVLRPEFTQNPQVVGRFTREAEAAAAIGHPAIIDIHDIGTAADESVFLVMEYLDGESLGDLTRAQGRLDPAAVAYVICQVLSALDAAHAKGIVHRDLKPDNVFLVNSGQEMPGVKLLDFGISKVIDRNNPDSRLTQTGAVMGTPYYMAPEQARGDKTLDHLVDIYSLGVILYQSVSGERPFKGGNMFALIHEVVNALPLPPTHHRPELAPEFEAVILKAMEKARADRFQLAAEMLEALLPFVEEHAVGQLTLGCLTSVAKDTTIERPDDDPDAEGLSSSRPGLSSSRPGLSGSRSGISGSRPGLSGSRPGLSGSRPGLSGSRSGISGSRPGLVDSSPGTGMAWQSRSDIDLPTGRRWTGLIIGVILAAVILGGGSTIAAVMFFGGARESSPQAAATEPAAPPADPQSDPEATEEPPPAEVRLLLTGVPEGAQVYLDDDPIEGTTLRRPRSTEAHLLRVSLEGHEPWIRPVTFVEDSSFEVELQASEAPADDDEPEPRRSALPRAARRQAPRQAPRTSRSSPTSGGRSGVRSRFGSEFE